jgi:hypothetical protein
LLVRSKSQAGQESFVFHALDGKRNGYFLEVGGHDGITMSNTLRLEKDFGWSGVALEWNSEFCLKYNLFRRNKCLELDATLADYHDILNERKFPKQIDYLQVDIDPADQSLEALKKIPFSSYRFSIITFEHDCYAVENQLENVLVESRQLLNKNGYQLIGSRIKHEGKEFEDWWIDPHIISNNSIKKFASDRKEGLSLFSLNSQILHYLYNVSSKIKNQLRNSKS